MFLFITEFKLFKGIDSEKNKPVYSNAVVAQFGLWFLTVSKILHAVYQRKVWEAGIHSILRLCPW